MKRLTTDSFIDKARKVHGDKYDYSITSCTGRHNKLSYICPHHGVITQEAGAHLQGHGCPKCAIKKFRDCADTQSFIEKAKKVHGDRYDYSHVNYKGYYNPVDIVCPKHGHFMQPAYLHLQGYDCKKCGYERTHKANRSTKDDFVRKAQKKFGDRYDYSHVVYRGCYEPVEIICRKHGAFFMNPTYHLIGHKCPDCVSENLIRRNRLTKEEFIKRARKIHGEKYDYSQVKYVSRVTPVTIICKKHGAFNQTPDTHLIGCGCQRCKQTNGESLVEDFLKKRRIKYIKEYTLPNLSLLCTRKFLLADFYLPEYNIIIEYNGEQHYYPVSIYGGEKTFITQQERDTALRIYCKENRIKLIEIPFYQKEEIGKILTKKVRRDERIRITREIRVPL